MTMMQTITGARTIVVDQEHARADDANCGTADSPLRTVQAAASIAEPGDMVVIRAGIYRERVAPARGGEPLRPITYMAAPGEKVFIRGSDVFSPQWEPYGNRAAIIRGPLSCLTFGAAAYAGQCDERLYGEFNPYHTNFNRSLAARPHSISVARARQRVEDAEKRLSELGEKPAVEDEHGFLTDARNRLRNLQREYNELTRTTRRGYQTTLGQVFLDGIPMREMEMLEELEQMPGSWMVDPEGESILLHPPQDVEDVRDHLVEASVRHAVFAPLKRGLGYITVHGLVIEHAANYSPAWGKTAYGQAGALSCRSGHHWIIEDCIVRHAKAVGIDCGREGGAEQCEFAETGPGLCAAHDEMDCKSTGYHIIRRNRISDNGHCGIAGIGHTGTQVLGNIIERNNCDGHTSPRWEFAGIKFHYFFDGVIEGNLIRDNEAHGIWLDNRWRGSRVTRNVILNNLWSGINIELGRGPLLVDHNVIALTRQGDGIYGHDLADVTIAHNLIYANANYGVWAAFATPRVKKEDGCWDIKTFNNMILGNRAGAIGYPLPWEAAGNNVSDGNLFMGAGEYLDEGSGPQRTLFGITSVSHMASMQAFLPFPAMTHERLRRQVSDILANSGVDRARWPNMSTWVEHPLLSMDLWQAVSGNDQRSQEFSTIRDGLNSQRMCWRITLDQALREVICTAVPGLERDFFGAALPEKPLPGPFQQLVPDEMTNLTFWPVPGVDAPRMHPALNACS